MAVDAIELCSRDTCTGCEACQNICPQNCIKMKEDREGFLYPEIDKDKCIRCNRCRNVCPILVDMPYSFNRESFPKTYVCCINDDLIRYKSSSGGLFSAIAKTVLEKNGVVFGAAFDKNMHLRHIGVEDITGLEKLRRSKYVQSEIGNSYKLVKELLDEGKLVFFVGTPCQIAGLNHFLGKDMYNLLTADFICHGVPSPGVFSEYVKYLEDIFSSRIKNIIFRDKQYGWHNSYFFVVAKLENGRKVVVTGKKNCFCFSFLKAYIFRKPCYNCAFKEMPRCGDFTLADIWGIQNQYPPEDVQKGLSYLLVNSAKGKKYLEFLNESINCAEESFSTILQGQSNLTHSASMNPKRQRFFNDFNQKPFAAVIKKYLEPPLKYGVGTFITRRLNFRWILLINKIRKFITQ